MLPTLITDEQRAAFERDGFLVVRNALSPLLVERLLTVVDRLYEKGLRDEGLSARNHWQMRNCIVQDEMFLELLDCPATFPLIVGILGWDIHLITSHLIVRPPNPADKRNENFKGEGWHRDGGLSPVEMQEPHPRLFIKVAYMLSDQQEPGRGNTQVVPGSNRLVGPPAQGPGQPHPYGAIEILGEPGDAFLFEQRTWHAVGPNLSDITRKSLFFGYGYRWVRAMDYQTPPEHLLPLCSPVRRQLLGEVKTPMGVYIPQDEDVPLRAWWKAATQQENESGRKTEGMM